MEEPPHIGVCGGSEGNRHGWRLPQGTPIPCSYYIQKREGVNTETKKKRRDRGRCGGSFFVLKDKNGAIQYNEGEENGT